MATANDLITAAYRRAKIIGADQTLTASEAADGLASLNRMLDGWWVDKLLVPYVLQENFTLTSGQVSRTIGATGNFGTERPVKIVDGCFVRRSSIDHPVKVIEDRTQYDRIANKALTGLVEALLYDPSYPNGTLYFYPVPDAADTIYLNSWKRLQSVSTLATSIVLPTGYDDLIVNGLAIKDAPAYGVSVPADVRRDFAAAKRNLGNVNAQSLVMSTDPALSRHRYSIETDR